MAYLIDSNCFLRMAESNSPQRTLTLDVIRKLRSADEIIYYTPQILAEFWNVCTRPPSARGGLGLSVAQTERKVEFLEKHFTLLPDDLATFTHWRRLVSEMQIKGVQVHDAKIAASMIAHKVPNLITFNDRDFRRFKMIKTFNPANM
jgi:predicted nucleic acid-binding protein